MNGSFIIFISFAGGIVLGIFFFGGLWLTLKRLRYTSSPVILTMGSYFIRISVCAFGFYIIARIGNWEGLLVSLGSFILTRFAMIRHLCPGTSGTLSWRDQHGEY